MSGYFLGVSFGPPCVTIPHRVIFRTVLLRTAAASGPRPTWHHLPEHQPITTQMPKRQDDRQYKHYKDTKQSSSCWGWRPTALTTTNAYLLVKKRDANDQKTLGDTSGSLFSVCVKDRAPYFRLRRVKMISMATSQINNFSTEIKLARHRHIQIVTLDLSVQFMPAVRLRYPAIPLSAACMRYVDRSTGSTVLGG